MDKVKHDKDQETSAPKREIAAENGRFLKEGYNAGIDMPVDIEPVPHDAPGAGLDVRLDMPDSGIVEVHDDDDEILDTEKPRPASR